MKIVIRDDKVCGCMSVGMENRYTLFFVCFDSFLYPCLLNDGSTYFPETGYRTRDIALEIATRYKERLETELLNNFRIEDLKNEA